MNFLDRARQQPLPLLGGVVQPQRLVVPAEAIAGLKSWRHACRLAWKLRNPRISQKTLAELVPCLYQSHVSEYFSALATTSKGLPRRELPAKHAGAVSRVLGNTVLIQWLCRDSEVTLLEEIQLDRRRWA